MNKKPFFTIHTPTYKRVSYINRVWEALNNQTFQDFEWIVSDDGSDDGTLALLIELKKISKFNVIVISAKKRVGKTILDNNAIKIANGELFLWNDSDDILLPNALERIYNSWQQIPTIEKDKISGITALCKSTKGEIASKLPYDVPFLTNWIEIRDKYAVTGDMLNTCRTLILRENLPPEVDFYIAEGAFWDLIATQYPTMVIPEELMLKEYRAPNCISWSGSMQYCRGYAYAMAICLRCRSSPSEKMIINLNNIKFLVTYFRYAIHGELSIKESFRLIDKSMNFGLITISSFFLAFTFSIRDNLMGKVIKTHREFDRVKSNDIVLKRI
jgi:glycosyltransferase involved in cell wall biosynthesis